MKLSTVPLAYHEDKRNESQSRHSATKPNDFAICLQKVRQRSNIGNKTYNENDRQVFKYCVQGNAQVLL